jgi:hypothetical protein
VGSENHVHERCVMWLFACLFSSFETHSCARASTREQGFEYVHIDSLLIMMSHYRCRPAVDITVTICHEWLFMCVSHYRCRLFTWSRSSQMSFSCGHTCDNTSWAMYCTPGIWHGITRRPWRISFMALRLLRCSPGWKLSSVGRSQSVDGWLAHFAFGNLPSRTWSLSLVQRRSVVPSEWESGTTHLCLKRGIV